MSPFYAHSRPQPFAKLILLLLSYFALLPMISSHSGVLFGEQRFVALTNGNVLQGDVQQLAEHVIVRTPTSEIRLAPSDVDVVAPSLVKIYQRKTQLASNGPSAREQLIIWCLRNNLPAEAKQEFRILRQRFPAYARLKIVEQQIQKFRSDLKPTTLPGSSPLHPDSQFAQERLKQLSKPTLADFARTVQPLMNNRCGLARCHGKGSTNSFQLLGLGRSSIPRNLMHRNLGAALRKIDGPAQQSLLWMSASSPHGGMQRKLRKEELSKLYQWIARVSHELGRELGREQGSQRGVSAVSQASAELPLDDIDPFDPAEFNAQSASPPATSSSQDQASQATPVPVGDAATESPATN